MSGKQIIKFLIALLGIHALALLNKFFLSYATHIPKRYDECVIIALTVVVAWLISLKKWK